MAASINFVIEGPIMAWQRPAGSGKKRYDPPDQVAYKEMVGWLCKKWMLDHCVKKFTGPVAFGCQVFYPLPQRRGKHWTIITPKTSAPDMSNLIKNIEDSLNGVAWLDDRQVSMYLPCGKWFMPSDFDGFDFAVVTIREVAHGDYPTERPGHGEIQEPARGDGPEGEGRPGQDDSPSQ
jgi:Holliday junction resolvase RusA-like endonuclease